MSKNWNAILRFQPSYDRRISDVHEGLDGTVHIFFEDGTQEQRHA